jgi:hypothetical protein
MATIITQTTPTAGRDVREKEYFDTVGGNVN